MRCFFVFIGFFLSVISYCQNNTQSGFSEKNGNAGGENILSCGYIEIPAVPLPDYNTWHEYLKNNLDLNLAEALKIPTGKYTVLMQFVVDREGCLTNFKVLKDPGFGLGKKVLKVFNNYKGHWKPGERNGRKVKSYKVQPITFFIEDE